MCHWALPAKQAGNVNLNVLMLRPAALLMDLLQEAGRAQDDLSGPSAWCCTLDADVLLLLTVEEEEQYLERSLKAAANSCPDLKSCPQPDCKGMAVAGAGETRVSRTRCELQPCLCCLSPASSKQRLAGL